MRYSDVYHCDSLIGVRWIMDWKTYYLILWGLSIIIGLALLTWFIWVLTSMATSQRRAAASLKSIAASLRSRLN